MAATNVNGMLLAAGTTELPPGVDYAFVIHHDFPGGRSLVADGHRHRTVDLPARGGKPPQKATPNGPRKVNKTWLPPPLPSGWHVNSVTLMYELRNAVGAVMMVSAARPTPTGIAIKKNMAVVLRLRREFEICIAQPCGRGDSDRY